MENLTFLAGKPLPYGACVHGDGVNFTLFSRNAVSIRLELFESEDSAEPYAAFDFKSRINKTGDIWHVFVKGLKAGALYLYKADGPFIPSEGLRFNRNNYLLDPYAKALTDASIFSSENPLQGSPAHIDGDLFFSMHSDAKNFPKCIVVDDDEFDWQNDRPLNYPMKNCIIYEAHVRGLSAHPNSPFEHKGTYRGIIEAIPYLKELGITSLELLPIQEFDENENYRVNPRTGEKLKNYWGYSTIVFFTPKVGYSSNRAGIAAVHEFKEMVRELHKAGIEVILDIVFNHTAEGNGLGPTLSFKGLDNSVYYMLEENKRYYRNYSGCGNTVSCGHPVVQSFIIQCLRYWVTEMHIDGFRFDLGSILGRDRNGNLLEEAPTLQRISEDPVLRSTKIIAEAWDAGGAYQVGSFPGRWAEWNDRFRDAVRVFWRGDVPNVHELATRITGSSDLYADDGRKPFSSVNFVTSHDGFTLYDLLSYNTKHNEENGENNSDGADNNNSYNHGFEGATDNAEIENLRFKKAKNLMVTLLLSLGTPMFLMGDEVLRTQKGNNNAYCQDNEISWFNWAFSEKQKAFLDFVKKLITFRKKHSAFKRSEFLTGYAKGKNAKADITWFNSEGKTPDWSKPGHFIAYLLTDDKTMAEPECNFYIMLNSSKFDVTATLPDCIDEKAWFRVIDTSYNAGDDFLEEGSEEKLDNPQKYVVLAFSAVVLISR
ncbi:MAG: glycogen debranching enzyme GlgX [Treponema sp.]|nr:MAG: glycogen debranching enzyme GlgX [Treponema sp.]